MPFRLIRKDITFLRRHSVSSSRLAVLSYMRVRIPRRCESACERAGVRGGDRRGGGRELWAAVLAAAAHYKAWLAAALPLMGKLEGQVGAEQTAEVAARGAQDTPSLDHLAQAAFRSQARPAAALHVVTGAPRRKAAAPAS